MSVQLPDCEIPEIGTPEREAHEQAALVRSYELIHEEEGRLRDALYLLEGELTGLLTYASERSFRARRSYARKIVRHVEQCWATAILEARRVL